MSEGDGGSTPKCVRGIPQVNLVLHKDRCLRTKTRGRVSSSKDVAALISEYYGCRVQESFIALHLNASNEVISAQEISLGGLTSTQVDPRAVFSGALLAGAPAIIVAHNHPSGNTEPSNEDRELTKILKRAGEVVYVRVLDHVIVGAGGKYFSFMENGLL